jgi:folylpolyglutamate synthase/dihydropteroate synthase
MAALLAPRVREVILTAVKQKQPLDPEQLKPLFAPVPARVVREPLRAIEIMMQEAAPNDVVLVTGSVYLIAEVYPWFLARQGRRGLFPEAEA